MPKDWVSSEYSCFSESWAVLVKYRNEHTRSQQWLTTHSFQNKWKTNECFLTLLYVPGMGVLNETFCLKFMNVNFYIIN